jgi:hypothetical protein
VSDTSPDTGRTLQDDILDIFMQGDWEQLGITGEQELTLRNKLRQYASQGVPPPNGPAYAAKRVWEEHRDRILREWTNAMGTGDLYTDCRTCPNCGCPGMN